jgi:hypothetical protein
MLAPLAGRVLRCRNPISHREAGMRRVALLVGAVLLAGCAKSETPPPAEVAAAPSINLADLAGTWTSVTTAQGSDSVLVTSTIVASADPAAWTITLPGRDPMPYNVTVSGDSLITGAGPYESVLRPGVQVTTTGVLHMVNGQLTGPMVAHYTTTGADSTLNLWATATRVP